MEILYFILVFCGGIFVGLMRYRHRMGTIFLMENEGKKTFLLELDDDPEKIEDQKIVVFRVKKNAPDNRE